MDWKWLFTTLIHAMIQAGAAYGTAKLGGSNDKVAGAAALASVATGQIALHWPSPTTQADSTIVGNSLK